MFWMSARWMVGKPRTRGYGNGMQRSVMCVDTGRGKSRRREKGEKDMESKHRCQYMLRATPFRGAELPHGNMKVRNTKTVATTEWTDRPLSLFVPEMGNGIKLFN